MDKTWCSFCVGNSNASLVTVFCDQDTDKGVYRVLIPGEGNLLEGLGKGTAEGGGIASERVQR